MIIIVFGKGGREMPRKDKEYWDTSAKGYTETVLGELEKEHRTRWENLLKAYLPKGETLSVLDAGCGPGYFSILLSSMGHTVTAIDFSEEMLKEAFAPTSEEDEDSGEVTPLVTDEDGVIIED